MGTQQTEVSIAEKAAIDKWISIKGLDKYGSRPGTMYAGGSPLFDMSRGVAIDRYDYIVGKRSDKPWKEFMPAHEDL